MPKFGKRTSFAAAPAPLPRKGLLRSILLLLVLSTSLFGIATAGAMLFHVWSNGDIRESVPPDLAFVLGDWAYGGTTCEEDEPRLRFDNRRRVSVAQGEVVIEIGRDARVTRDGPTLTVLFWFEENSEYVPWKFEVIDDASMDMVVDGEVTAEFLNKLSQMKFTKCTSP